MSDMSIIRDRIKYNSPFIHQDITTTINEMSLVVGIFDKNNLNLAPSIKTLSHVSRIEINIESNQRFYPFSACRVII